MKRAQRDAATSTRSARTMPRVTLRATIGDAPLRRVSEVADDQDQGGAKDHDEQGREDAPDEREEHLDRRLRGGLLRALPAFDPELFGLDLEHLRDRDAELLGLDDRADEVGERLDLGARHDVPERLAPDLADPYLGERPTELVHERALHLLDDLAERSVKTETGPDGDRQEVEGVRDLEEDRLLAL